MSAFRFNASRLLDTAGHCIALEDWENGEEGKSLHNVSRLFPCKPRKRACQFPDRSTS